jgi:hypothetical protein
VRQRGTNRQKQTGDYAGRTASGGVQLLPDRLNPAADRAFTRRFPLGRIGDEPLLHLNDQIALPHGETSGVDPLHQGNIEPVLVIFRWRAGADVPSGPQGALPDGGRARLAA